MRRRAPRAEAMAWRSRRPGRPPAGLLLAVLLAATLPLACGDGRSLVVTATAYNSHPSQTDREPTVAAWGDELEPGMRAIAVSPDLLDHGLEHGTKVFIEGFSGPYTVLDKTAGRRQRHIDIYMGDDIERARRWGVRRVRIRW